MNIIKKLVTNWSAILCLTLCTTVVCSSCGDDDDDNLPVNEGLAPDNEVSDPTGTMTVFMRNKQNGGGTLGDSHIYINAVVFTSDKKTYFVSLGKKNNLDDVSYIPSKGWTTSVAVTPGYGYVAYDKVRKKFYRIYVKGSFKNSNGEFIGYEIEYQAPFKGNKYPIIPNLSTWQKYFDKKGGTQTLTFENADVIPFNIQIQGSGFTVKKISTYDHSFTEFYGEEPFLYNGITVTAEPNTSSETIKRGTITLTTLHGYKTIIEVLQGGK